MLPVSEKALDVMEWQNVLADNDCRVYSHCHHYFVDLFWDGGILAGNSVSERELPPLYFAVMYLYFIVWMDSCNHLSALSFIRSFIFLLSDLRR